MSRIDEMIQGLCPNGVPIKPLGDVGAFTRGSGLQKSDLSDAGVPAIHYGQVHTHYGTWAMEALSFTSPDFAKRLRKAEPGDLVIATTSEDDEGVAKAVAWLGEEEAAISGDAYIYHHSLDPKYVAYFFQSDQFQNQKMRSITGAKVRRISGESLAKIKIPVPPVEVQQEIVRVLDQFSASDTELARQIDDEVVARRLQYSRYRDLLLNLGDAPRVKLGDVATVKTGQAPPAGVLAENGTYAFVNAGTTESGRAIEANTPAGGVITIPSRGQGGVGIAGYQADSFWCGPLCYRISSASGLLLTRFLYHYLKSIQAELRALQQTGGTPALNRKELVLVEVPVPSLNEQERVIEILDELNLLVTELCSVLPAERVARRRQYEYYRDKLLTFEEAVA